MPPDGVDSPGASAKPGGNGWKWSREVGPFLTLGLQLAITVVVFFFLGQWLDRELDTEPWLMLTGVMIGVVGGILKFIKTAMEIGKQSEKRNQE